MVKAKAKINDKTLEVLTKTKKGASKKVAKPEERPPRSRSRSRTPGRPAKVKVDKAVKEEKPVVQKSEAKKQTTKKTTKVNSVVVEIKTDLKRLDTEPKKKRGAPRKVKAATANNSTPTKKMQDSATPTRKQPRRLAAMNSGNSHVLHKIDEDFVDSPITVDFNNDSGQLELEETNTGGGGWFSRCSVM